MYTFSILLAQIIVSGQIAAGPAPPRGRPARWRGRTGRPAWCWPSPAPRASLDALASVVDDVVCAEMPSHSRPSASGTSTSRRPRTPKWWTCSSGRTKDRGPRTGNPAARDVIVLAGTVPLPGRLTVPPQVRGVVVFAHGTGSSRNSPRNMFVAGTLHVVGLGSLLFDLLTPDEEADRANVFDIGLLAGRLSAATSWLRGQPGLERVPVGYFGASAGAAAALRAAAGSAADPGEIAAVVSRGGRPDLAGASLGAVRAPTLLLVGGLDDRVLELNEAARAQLPGESQLVIIPGAGHLFAEPGTLEQVASLARDWFLRYLRAGPPPAGRVAGRTLRDGNGSCRSRPYPVDRNGWRARQGLASGQPPPIDPFLACTKAIRRSSGQVLITSSGPSQPRCAVPIP